MFKRCLSTQSPPRQRLVRKKSEHSHTQWERTMCVYGHHVSSNRLKNVFVFQRWEREVMHFLLSTKDTHIGIVAGKLLYFSRHLSVTVRDSDCFLYSGFII